METKRILGEYLRRDLHTSQEEDGTLANDRRDNSPKTCQVPKSLTSMGIQSVKPSSKKSIVTVQLWAGQVIQGAM